MSPTYREKPVGPVAWLVLAALILLGLYLVRLRLGTLDGLALAIVGVVAVPAAIAMWSTNHYSGLRITDTHLIVGRDRIPLSSIDPASVRAPGEPDPAPRGNLAGGGYAVPLGMKAVAAFVHGRGQVRFPTHRPEELAEALRAALTRSRG